MCMSYHISCTIGRTFHVREIVNKKKKKKKKKKILLTGDGRVKLVIAYRYIQQTYKIQYYLYK